MQSPTATHWDALKWLLRYLNSTIDHGIFITPQSSLIFHVFLDAD